MFAYDDERELEILSLNAEIETVVAEYHTKMDPILAKKNLLETERYAEVAAYIREQGLEALLDADRAEELYTLAWDNSTINQVFWALVDVMGEHDALNMDVSVFASTYPVLLYSLDLDDSAFSSVDISEVADMIEPVVRVQQEIAAKHGEPDSVVVSVNTMNGSTSVMFDGALWVATHAADEGEPVAYGSLRDALLAVHHPVYDWQ